MVVDSVLFVGEEEFHQDTWIELDPIAEGKGRDGDAVPVAVVEEIVKVEPEVSRTRARRPRWLSSRSRLLMEEPPPLVAGRARGGRGSRGGSRRGSARRPRIRRARGSGRRSEAVGDARCGGRQRRRSGARGRGGGRGRAGTRAVVPSRMPTRASTPPSPRRHASGRRRAHAGGGPESFDVAVAAAAAAAVIVEPDEIAEAEPEHDRAVEAVIAVAAASALLPTARPGRRGRFRPGSRAGGRRAAVGAVVADPDALAEPEPEDDTEESAVAAAVAPVPDRPARHTFDPLADDAPTRRRWRRRDDPWVEVPSRPPKPLALPGAARREP